MGLNNKNKGFKMFGTNPGLNKKNYETKLEGISALYNSVMDTYVTEQRKKDYYNSLIEHHMSKGDDEKNSTLDQGFKSKVHAYAYILRSISFGELSFNNNIDTGIELAKKIAPFCKHQSAAALTELAMAVIFQDNLSPKNAEKAQGLIDLSLQLYPKGKNEFDTIAMVEDIIAHQPSQSNKLSTMNY